jgi:NADH-quinone oxidoreductase subunit A
MNNLVAVAGGDWRSVPVSTRQDGVVAFYGDAIGGDTQMREHSRDAGAGRYAFGFTVYDNRDNVVHLTSNSTAAIITCAFKAEIVSQAYAPLLMHVLVAMGVAGLILLASSLIGWRRPSRTKGTPYECGVLPTGDAREPFSVKFYLVAMVFILFDVEAVFLYPWAYVFKELGWFGFFEMLIYILILLAGYIYLWKKGVLDWSNSGARRDQAR